MLGNKAKTRATAGRRNSRGEREKKKNRLILSASGEIRSATEQIDQAV